MDAEGRKAAGLEKIAVLWGTIARFSQLLLNAQLQHQLATAQVQGRELQLHLYLYSCCRPESSPTSTCTTSCSGSNSSCNYTLQFRLVL